MLARYRIEPNIDNLGVIQNLLFFSFLPVDFKPTNTTGKDGFKKFNDIN